MTKLAMAAAIYITAYWAYHLICIRAATKNKRKALATLKAAGIPTVCVCGWRNEPHEGLCTPYAPNLPFPQYLPNFGFVRSSDAHIKPETVAQFKAKMDELSQPKAPACGVAPSCNSCHDCPDLKVEEIKKDLQACCDIVNSWSPEKRTTADVTCGGKVLLGVPYEATALPAAPAATEYCTVKHESWSDYMAAHGKELYDADDKLTALPAIDTTHDSRLYMRGFEDGQAVAQAKMQSDRDALERHWHEKEI